jgi:putative ATP-dependent endonuclease of OLD family
VRLVTFSIQRYRSIMKAERLAFRDFTVLVGPNNEGKSNILQGLIACMDALENPTPLRAPLARLRGRDRFGYSWARDYPRTLQNQNADGRTIFNLDFQLTPDEIREFKDTVGSELNGVLPIQLTFGRSNRPNFAVRKQRHSAALTAKRDEISQFVADHLAPQYIPAARTAEVAVGVVNRLVSEQLREAARTNAGYRDALDKIQEVQRPIIEALEATICSTLQQLLPEVRDVSLEISERRPLAPQAEILVDDGTPTALEFKGDGVQSLATLSLLRFASERQARASTFILVVEEPEAHLHSRAIHEIAAVLRATSETQQVIVATHSPLFVNRFDPASNIIVEKSRARPAASVAELREVLGVRTSDALDRAEVALVVEGKHDVTSLTAILAALSTRLREELQNGTLALVPLHGGGNLPYMLSVLSMSLSRVHVFLDDDKAAHEAADLAKKEGLLAPADETFAKFAGVGSAELEDLYDPEVYREALLAAYGVDSRDLATIKLSRGKWSERLHLLFSARGKGWDDGVERAAKAAVAAAVAASPRSALQPIAQPVIEGLIIELERKVARDAA